MTDPNATAKVERALLAMVIVGRQTEEAYTEALEELERLAGTVGIQVVGSLTQRRDRPDPGTFMGQGKLAELQLACRASYATVIIFDNTLSSTQVNNLSRATGIPVMDRTELILQIFARRARSAEAQMQVELAQLEYQASRVQTAERQQRFHGGIGARGPGESPFQLHKAPMLRRISMLKRKLKEVSKRRERTRERRPWPVVCLIGYTNAGKSTLLNALADAGAYADDRLFATLDTKSRALQLPGGRKILLTDTVGFIRNLPHNLVASFRSTLEEISEADLLLLTADASHPHVEQQMLVVTETLATLKADSKPRLVLLNKTDLEDAKTRIKSLMEAFPEALPISAIKRTGLDTLANKLANMLE